MGEPLSFRSSPRGHHQGEYPYKLGDCLNGHRGISYYYLAPNIMHEQASIFQEAPQGVAIMVKTHIVCETVQVAIEVYFSIG